jgi:hypothetical protein
METPESPRCKLYIGIEWTVEKIRLYGLNSIWNAAIYFPLIRYCYYPRISFSLLETLK